ncbi:MAG: Lrp/AsnC ligand binding domain-containing protein [Candidatus Methanomethylicaceae archaeon]
MVQVLVLINAEKVSVLDIVSKLEKFPEVLEAFPTFGRFDVIAFCNANDREGVRALVKKIGSLEGVLKTESLVEL